MKKILLSVIFAITLNSVTAQVNSKQQVFTGPKANEICEGSKSVRYSDKSAAPAFISFGEHSTISSGEALSSLKKALNIGTY